MCDQTIPYKIGDLVWVYLLDRVWWPGVVVEASNTPESYQEFIKKKKLIAVVHFPNDGSYEGVVNLNKITMYNSNRKHEFLKKGYFLYQKQIKSKKVKLVFDMTHFVADVIHFEKETGGDENIFKQFEEKEVHKPLQININELFTTEKSRKSKARKSVSVRGRRSLPASKISTPLPIKKKPSTPKTISKSKPVSTTLSLNNTSINQKYVCYFDTQNKCSFFTNRFELLKRHMAEHKAKAELMKQSATSSNNSNTNTQLSTSTSIKRNCAKPKKSCTKKIKLHDEILKEWDIDEAEDSNDKVNEGEDKNKLDTNSVENEGKEEDKKVFVTNTVEGGKENDLDKSSVEDEKNTNINKVENEKNDFDANTNEDKNVVENISQGTSGLDNNVEEDISTMNKLKENIPHTIFDFDEDDSSNYIPDLRPSKSDINSTLDDEINDSFGHKCDQEFITSTIFESTKSQPHVKESETEDTNDFENEIESSKLLLKKTVNTLDQINNLEESMNNISSNKSKLIGDNQSSESLNEIVKNNVDAGDYLIKSPVEMQQSNDNEESSSYMVNDDENKKLCSNEDSTHMQNIETEDVDPTENGRYECLLDGLPSPDWIKEDSWESFPENGLQEAMKLLTIDTHHCMDFLNFESLKPSLIDLSVEPTVVHRIEEHKPPGKKLIVTIRVPVLKNKTKLQSTEQLMLLPTVQECVEFNKCESPNSFCFDFVEGSYVIHKEEINY